MHHTHFLTPFLSLIIFHNSVIHEQSCELCIKLNNYHKIWMKQLKWSKKEDHQPSNLLQALAWCIYITCVSCVSSHIRTPMLEMGMASEIYIYSKEPKILLNYVSVKASRQTKTMFGLFWELCTVCSGTCLK